MSKLLAAAGLALLAFAALPGCAHLRNDQTVCPEARGLRCVVGTRCSMDQRRGCRVCECERMDMGEAQPPGSTPDSPELPPTDDPAGPYGP